MEVGVLRRQRRAQHRLTESKLDLIEIRKVNIILPSSTWVGVSSYRTQRYVFMYCIPSGGTSTLLCVLCLVAQSCLILCDSMDCTPPILEWVAMNTGGRMLELVAMPTYRGSSQPRDWTQVSHMAGRFPTIWALRKPVLCFMTALLFDFLFSVPVFLCSPKIINYWDLMKGKHCSYC